MARTFATNRLTRVSRRSALRTAGPDAYTRWYQGKLAWTSEAIKKAWTTWGTIVGDPKLAYGGSQYMLSTSFGTAGDPLFTSPPRAYLHHEASFFTSFITKDNPTLKPLTDGNYGTDVLANRMYAEMFTDDDFGRASAIAVILLLAVVPVVVGNIQRFRQQEEVR